jgi:hypothetical protein
MDTQRFDQVTRCASRLLPDRRGEPRTRSRLLPRTPAQRRAISVGLLSGLAAGLVGGVAGRVVMRVIAVAGGDIPEFTVLGTAFVLFTAAAYGSLAGHLFVAVRPYLPGSGVGKTLAFGVALTLLFGLLFLVADQEGELHLAPRLAFLLFSLLAFGVGVLVAGLAGYLKRSLPAPPHGDALYRSLTVLAVVVGLLTLPGLLWRVGLVAGRLAAVV